MINLLRNFVYHVPELACWMITGERQAARIRGLYLQTILRQDVTFFDKETNTGEVVGRMSGDTVLIQDAMGEKVLKNHPFLLAIKKKKKNQKQKGFSLRLFNWFFCPLIPGGSVYSVNGNFHWRVCCIIHQGMASYCCHAI